LLHHRPPDHPPFSYTTLFRSRHPDASSNIEEFTRPRFLPLVPDHEIRDASRILIASGKVGHELRVERRRRKDTSTAIFFLDQLRSEEHTSDLQSHLHFVCRLL